MMCTASCVRPLCQEKEKVGKLDLLRLSLVGELPANWENYFPDKEDFLYRLISTNEIKPQGGWDLLGIKQLSASLESSVQRIIDKTDDVMEQTTMLGNLVTGRIENSVDKIVSSTSGVINNSINTFQDLINRLSEWFSGTQGAIIFAVVYIVLSFEDLFPKTSLRPLRMIVAGAAVTYFSKDTITRILSPWYSSIFGTASPQSGIGDWIGLFIEGLTILVFGCKVEIKTFTGMLDSLTRISRDLTNLEALFKKIYEWVQKLLSKIAESFGLNVSEWFLSNDKHIRNLQKEVNEMMQVYLQDPMSVNAEFSRRVTILSMKINELIVRTPISNGPAKMAVTKLQEQINNLIRFVAEQGVGIGEREEPGIIVIAGPPGAGKTYFADFLMQKFAVQMASNEDELFEIESNWKSQVYTWPVDGKHHDQYKGETVVSFPDLFARKDVAGSVDSEPLSLIYLVGGQDFVLPAAELTKKQLLHFVSKLIVACTNVTYIPDSMFDSVRNGDAVRRRVNECSWYMYPNPKYALKDRSGKIRIDPSVKKVKGYEDVMELYAMIDNQKIPYEAGEGIREDLYLFRKFSFTTGTFVDECIYKQADVYRVSEAYLRNKTLNGERKRELINATLKKAIAKRREELSSDVIPQATRCEFTPMVDKEFKKRMAKIAEDDSETVDSFHTAKLYEGRHEKKKRVKEKLHTHKEVDEGIQSIKVKSEKSKHSKYKKRNRYIPQGDDTEVEDANPKDWFEYSFGDTGYQEKVEPKLRFLYEMRQTFSEEVYDKIKYYYAHAAKGCTIAGTDITHVCSGINEFDFKKSAFPYEGRKHLLRMLCNDEKTVLFCRYMKVGSFIAVAKMTYAEAREQIIRLIIMGEYGDSYMGRFAYMRYTFAEMFMPFWSFLKEQYDKLYFYVMPHIAPFIPFIRGVVLGGAISVALNIIAIGIGLLFGDPTIPVIDQYRKTAQKNWHPLYVQFLHSAQGYEYADYVDFDEYKEAKVKCVQVEGNDNIKRFKVVVPRLISAPQANWKREETWSTQRNLVTENCYMMYYRAEEKCLGGSAYMRHCCNIMFLGDVFAVMVDHAIEGITWLVDYFKKDVHSYIILVPFGSDTKPQDSPYRFMWKDIVVHQSEDRKKVDLCVLEFPRSSIRAHSHLEKMIAPKECLDYIVSQKQLTGIYLKKPLRDIYPDGPVKPIDVYLNMQPDVVSYVDRPSFSREMSDGRLITDSTETPRYSYLAWGLRGMNTHFETNSGDCSSPCLLTDPRKNFCINKGYLQAAQPWIVYLHSAKHGTVPRGIPIFRELFSDVFDRMKTKVSPLLTRIERDLAHAEEVMAEELEVTVPNGAVLEIIEENVQLDKVHYTECAIKADINLYPMSNIKRSKLYGIEERLRAPARLRNFVDPETGEEVNVLGRAEEKYGSNNVCPNLQLVNSVIHNVVNRMFNDNDAEKRVSALSLEQALLGDVGHNLKGIDMQTSAGMQLRLLAKKFGFIGKGKTFMLDAEGKIQPEFMRILTRLVNEAESILANGDRISNVYINNLKDELVLKAKVKIGKTRLFCSSDFIYLILCRMYFGAFAGWNFRGRIRNGIAIGVNVYSREWDALYHRMNDFTKKFVFGDYSGFDKLQKSYLMRSCLMGIHRFYGDIEGSRDWLIRMMLFEDMASSIHLTVRNGKLYIYEWEHGNTSGNFLTAIINSWVNIAILHLSSVYAQLLHKGIDPLDATPVDYNWEEVEENMIYIVLGDDVIVGFKGVLSSYMNFQVMEYVIPKYIGLTFTDELKGTDGKEVPPFRALLDGSFLGRKFSPVKWRGKEKIFAPLRMYSVIEHVQWVKGLTDPEIEVAKVELLLLELSEYPREVFDARALRYAEACREAYGRYPRYTDFDDARERVMFLSSDRYSFETFLVEDTYKESDLVKLGLLNHLMNLPFNVNGYDLSLGESEESQFTEDLPSSAARDAASFSSKARTETVLNTSNVIPQSGKNEVTDFTSDVTIDRESTTTFYESAPVAAGTRSMPTAHVSTYVEELADIKAFLAKPRLLHDGEWLITNAANTNLCYGDIANLLDTVPVWAEKSRGFNLIRGDFILRVEINASPFQQGKLLVHYIPCCKDFIANSGTPFLNRTNKIMAQKVQHPHVELSADKSAALLRIPYVAPTQYYARDQEMFDWGRYFVDVFAPLKTGSGAPTSQQAVSYLVYGYWENVEMIAPVYIPEPTSVKAVYVPESNNKERKVINRNVVNEAAENMGPIEHGLRTVGKLSRDLSNIPLLHDYAKTTGWASDILANMAHTMGWSKPRELTGVKPVTDQMFRYHNTCDGPNLAMPGGLKSDNCLSTLDYASYTNEDEMSFEYLFKIPFYAGIVTWNTAAAPGTSLGGWYICPSIFYAAVTDTAGGRTAIWRQYAPFGYLSNFFKYWRGGIKVTLKFVKTRMHSGKLQVTFNPGTNPSAGVDLENSTYCLRAIVDIKTEDEVTFVLPYLSFTDYLETIDSTGYFGDSGHLRVMVLNELKGPETVAQEIDMQVFFSAAEDFELAAPYMRVPGLVPYIPQSSNGETVEKMHGDVGQSIIANDVIGKQSINMDKVFHSERCIGEKILSVKQLLLRSTPLINIKVGNSFPGTGYVRPHYLPATRIVAASGTFDNPNYGGDMLGFIAPMFAFMRGSVNIMFTDITEPNTNQVKCRFLAGTGLAPNSLSDAKVPIGAYASGTPMNLQANAPAANTSQVIKSTWTNNAVGTNAVEGNDIFYQHVPYHCQIPYVLTWQYSGLEDMLQLPLVPQSHVAWMVYGTTYPLLQRSVGDDFRCHFFIGCPPLLFSTS